MVVTLEAGTASSIAQLLDFLSQIPGTPDFVKQEAREHSGCLEELLPAQHAQMGPGARAMTGEVRMEEVAATAIAGMLDLLAGMPSTPPPIMDEARARAETLWRSLQPHHPREAEPTA